MRIIARVFWQVVCAPTGGEDFIYQHLIPINVLYLQRRAGDQGAGASVPDLEGDRGLIGDPVDIDVEGFDFSAYVNGAGYRGVAVLRYGIALLGVLREF